MVNAGKFGCSSDVEMGIWKYIKASGLVGTLEKNTFIVSNSASCLVLIAIGVVIQVKGLGWISSYFASSWFVSYCDDFVRVHLSLSQSRRQLQDFTDQPKNNVEKRLLAIPLLFILLRIWGTLQFFYSLAVAGQNHGGCIPSTVRNAFMIIGVLQVRTRTTNNYYTVV